LYRGLIVADHTIPTELLLAYASGELQEPERAEIERRLAVDAEARATLALYESAHAALSTDDSVAPPAHAAERAKAIFAAPMHERGPNWLELAHQLVAKLVFDSRAEHALAGIRSIHGGCSLMFETERESVDVQAEPVRDAEGHLTRWQIIGQVAHEEDVCMSPVAFLRHDDQSVAAFASLDERGVFTLDVEPGVFQVRIGLRGHTLILPAIDLS